MPQSRKPIPTIQEVERSGKLVSARNNPFGFTKKRLRDWRAKGCPYIRGRKLRAKKVRVLDGGPHEEVWFYDVATLAKIKTAMPHGKRFGRYKNNFDSRSAKREWKRYERFTDDEGTWLAARVAARFVHSDRGTVAGWAENCPHLESGLLRSQPGDTGFGRTGEFYLIEDLKAIKKEIASLATSPTKGASLSLVDASKLLGISTHVLRKEWLALGLNVNKVPVRHKNGKTRKKRRTRGSMLEFQRAEVEKLAAKWAAPLPPDRMTVKDAMALLKAKKSTVHSWCNRPGPGGHIIHHIEDFRRGKGGQRPLLLLKSDVEAIRTALQGGVPAGQQNGHAATTQTPSATDQTGRAGRHGPGRPASPDRQAMYEFCYQQYRVKGRKRSNVFREAQSRFRKNGPKAESEVTVYANRYADNNNLPRIPAPRE